MDPERVHEWATHIIRSPFLGPAGFFLRTVFGSRDPALRTEICGIPLEHPIGVAAGFDKNATLYPVLHRLGFSFVEVGTVTAQAQPGNPKPRLFRLPQDRALINRMGFNNEGVERVASRLSRCASRVPLGGNIGKTKIVPLDEANGDYLRSFLALKPFVDYFVVNVSSPNTPGLRKLQDKDRLADLLHHLAQHNGNPRRPILLKIAPDLSSAQLLDIVEVVEETGIDGVIATNTTLSREGLVTPRTVVARMGEGGLSGRPIGARATRVIAFLRRHLPDRVDIVGVGGIFDGRDAFDKITAGACCVQMYTGFIYSGPSAVFRIQRQLRACLKREGVPSISEAVGLRTDDFLD